MFPIRCSPSTSAKVASATWPRAEVRPLLNDPVTVPSAPMLKLAKVPLLLPSCWVDDVLLGAATCVITGVVPSNSFQVNVRLFAPSVKFGIVMPVTSALGLVSVPVPSKVRLPLVTCPAGGGGGGGVPVPAG